MKFLTALFLALSCSAALATIDTRGLSEAQIKQLSDSAAQLKQENGNPSAVIRREAEAWGELGGNMGKAIVAAAKEIGVEANNFSQTPLGKIVTFVVLYKIVGAKIIAALAGIVIGIAGWILGIWFIRTRHWSATKYEYIPTLFGLYNVKRVVEVRAGHDTSGQTFIGCGILIISTGLSLILLLG